jgi:hypothetical protein
LNFDLVKESTGETRSLEQPVCLWVERGSTWWTRLAALLFAAAGLLPLVALGAFNRINGRLPRNVSAATIRAVIAVSQTALVPIGAPQASLFSDGDFRDAGASSHRLSVDESGVQLRALALSSRPRAGRGRFSLSMLFTGPRTYLMPIESPVVVGCGDDVLHTGALDEPLRIPRNFHNLWVVKVDEVILVTGVRIMGQPGTLYEFEEAINSRGIGPIEEIRREGMADEDDDSIL